MLRPQDLILTPGQLMVNEYPVACEMSVEETEGVSFKVLITICKYINKFSVKMQLFPQKMLWYEIEYTSFQSSSSIR